MKLLTYTVCIVFFAHTALSMETEPLNGNHTKKKRISLQTQASTNGSLNTVKDFNKKELEKKKKFLYAIKMLITLNLPDENFEKPALYKLSLENEGIQHLPHSIALAVKLKKAQYQYNGKYFEIGDIIREIQPKKLNLSNNVLKTLPSRFSALSKYLGLS
jgi:hypothetical protein